MRPERFLASSGRDLGPLRRLLAVLIAAALLVTVMGLEPAAAQSSEDPEAADADSIETDVPALVLPSPGAGYWLVLADGEVVAVGDVGDSPPPDLSGEAMLAHPEDRGIGFLAGTVARQYLSGSSVDPHLECTSELNLTIRTGQTLMPGINWAVMGSLDQPLASGLIGGLVVLGTPPASIAASIVELRGVAMIEILVAVDEEGGRVQRLRAALGRFPSAQRQALDNTPAELRDLVALHGQGVRSLGFDMNLAPVLDVGAGPGIGDRAYGDEPGTVIEYGLAVVDGLQDAGLVPVVKHFPGHGRASVDSHVSLPTTPSHEELTVTDLEPFRVAIAEGISAVMVGHLDVPGLTDGAPASLSPEAVEGLLRGELGFEGLVMSDALSMGAITERWSTPEAVVLGLIAGVDVLLLGDAEELEAIHSAVSAAINDGRLDDRRVSEAAARVLSMKGLNACVVATGLLDGSVSQTE